MRERYASVTIVTYLEGPECGWWLTLLENCHVWNVMEGSQDVNRHSRNALQMH